MVLLAISNHWVTLVGHPSIHYDFFRTFTKYLIGVSPILANGALGIIQDDKTVRLNNNHYISKICRFCNQLFQTEACGIVGHNFVALKKSSTPTRGNN